MRNRLLKQLPDYQKSEEILVTTDFHFEVITPFLGGDAKSWELNLDAPIRTQSIKGQLRFWWRTLQNESDYKTMLKKENELWGGKSGKDRNGRDRHIKSPIKIAVLDQKNLSTHHAELNDKGFALKDEVIPTYVAFPVTDALKNKKQDVVYIKSAKFTLRVTYQKQHEKSIIPVLKLWTLFGGVGARTRRGCGSLYCESLLADFETADDICAFIRSFSSTDQKELAYCRLAGALCAWDQGGDDPAKTWDNLIRKYAAFRQDRVPKSPKPGRSYWPEPDAIRRVTNQASPLHQPSHPDGIWFPRAAFGLPIITKFNTRDNGHGDPDPQVQLLPDIGTGERWPSPVILKVIKLNSGVVIKMALVLGQKFPEKLRLDQKGRSFPLDQTASPFAKGPHQMKTRNGFKAPDSVYTALFEALNLKELP